MASMSIRVEVVCIADDGSEQRREVMAIERRELAIETLGLTLKEGKALLAGVQDFVVTQQARQHLEQRRRCPQCGQRHTTKDNGNTPVNTVFGLVQVANPRWNRCACQADGPQTFRPMRTWLQERTTPEMRYLETRWASLIPFARVVDLLKDVLPVGFRRKTQSKALHELKLHRQEKFLYICDTLHMWEWDVRVVGQRERFVQDPRQGLMF
jgi:hypothetical protein